MLSYINQLIEWFIDPVNKVDGEDTIRRARMVTISTMMGIAVGSIYSLLHLFIIRSLYSSVILATTTISGVLILFIIIGKKRSYRLAANINCLLLLSVVSIIAYMEGNFPIGTVMWFLLVAILGPHLIGIRDTLFWVLAACLILVFLYVNSEFRVFSQPILVVSPETTRQFDLLLMIALMIITFLFMAASERLILRSKKEKSEVEYELQQAQRLESVGLLAGGIAHDFNNLLSIILTHANLIYEEVEPESQIRPDVQSIQDAGERAADLVRQLLQFSRKEIDQPELLDLNKILLEINDLLKRTIGENISLHFRPSRKLWTIKIDHRQIQQILLNFAVNARDAISGEGTLLIRTANVRVTDPLKARKLEIEPGNYVKLVVQDSGCGMSQAVRMRAFEPFFTTKPVGKGSGLGLSTTYGIVRKARGSISVQSREGEGTSFTVLLPAFEKVAKPKKVEVEVAIESLSPDFFTILLVEDDDGVRSATRRILSKSGFEVLPARDGEEALSICRHHSKDIDILLTDVVMPGISGSKLAEMVTAQYSDVAVVFMSGYAGDEVVQNDAENGNITFIQKPFNENMLRRAIDISLGRKGKGTEVPIRIRQ